MKENIDTNKFVEVESAWQDTDCTSTIIKRKKKREELTPEASSPEG